MSESKQSLGWYKQKAYSGKLGRERELFCREYTKQKASVTKLLNEVQIKQAESNQAQITCKKQCRHSSCCMEFVEATIQECETIVYYLYNHEEALSKFLKNYPKWRKKVSFAGDLHAQISKIHPESFSNQPTENQAVVDLYQRYFNFHIPCPFLSDNLCIVYDVRPYTCAGYYVISPIEFCSLDSKDIPHIYRQLPTKDLRDLSFYYGTLLSARMLLMPLNVYEILTKGYAHISEISGLIGLEKEAKRQHLIRRF